MLEPLLCGAILESSQTQTENEMNKFFTESSKMALVAQLFNLRKLERSLVAGFQEGTVSESAYLAAMEASEAQGQSCLAAGITKKDLQSV